MYEPFFELKQRPFLSGPVAARYFPATVIEHARQSLMRCVQRAQGTGLIVGPTGTGKSLLCNVLAQQFRASHRTVLLAGAKLCTRKALFQSILFSLGLPYREMSEGELRLALTSRLEPNVDATAGLLLIVDEADTLPVRLLEELRMLTNLVRDGAPRVHLILAGAPALEERFASPKFESFNQRIAARCHLQPLDREETARYVAWQIATTGGRPEFVFDWSAAGAIYETTGGIPRLINQVCDYALHAAAVAGERPLMARHLTAAWAELQKTPSPWAAHAPAARPAPTPLAVASPGIIEFRSLDELPPMSTTSLTEFDFSGSPSLLDQDPAETHTTTPAPVAVPHVAAEQLPVVSHDAPVADSSVPETGVPAASVTEANDRPPTTVDPLWEATSQTTVVAPFSDFTLNESSSLCMAVAPLETDWHRVERSPAPIVEDAPESVVARLHETLGLDAIPVDPAWGECAEELDAHEIDDEAVPPPLDITLAETRFEYAADEPVDGAEQDVHDAAASMPEQESHELESIDDEAPEGAILRIVRDEEPEPTTEEAELAPPAERRRRFRELFTRLRRRASA